jgi:hypothetical protein
MRFLRALAIALITSVAGMFLAIFASDYLTKLYHGASQFIELKELPPTPRKESETWSDWIVATQYADLTPIPANQRMSVRYRVRIVD